MTVGPAASVVGRLKNQDTTETDRLEAFSDADVAVMLQRAG